MKTKVRIKLAESDRPLTAAEKQSIENYVNAIKAHPKEFCQLARAIHDKVEFLPTLDTNGNEIDDGDINIDEFCKFIMEMANNK